MSGNTSNREKIFLDPEGIPILTESIPVEASQILTAGAIVSNYRLLRQIGRGATAIVFLCEHLTSGNQYAIKMLQHDLASDWHHKMLANEARLAGRLAHKNIASIYDGDPEQGFIVMEYVEGKSLDHYSSKEKLLPVHMVVNIIKEVAEALNYSSRQNVLHLDIKPGNIIVSEDFSKIKLMDFGCASIDGNRDEDLQAAGSVNYMSPEQLATDSRLDVRSDIYSLGSVFYRLITGEVTYKSQEGLAFPQVIQLIRNKRHIPIREHRQDVDNEVIAIIDRMLAKNPEKRYPSWVEVIFDLARLSVGLTKRSMEQGTLALISECPLFKDLPESDLQELFAHSRLVELPSGTTLVHEGSTGDSFYIILQGGLNISKQNETLWFFYSGDIVGEEACFTEFSDTYNFTIKAAKTTRLLAMSRVKRQQLNLALRERLNESLLRTLNIKFIQLSEFYRNKEAKDPPV